MMGVDSDLKTKARSKPRSKVREALELKWLQMHERGKSMAKIAAAEGVSKATVQFALSRARAVKPETDLDDQSPIRDAPRLPRQPWWLELVPLFPIGAFTPASECPHHGPIRPGSLFCCMVCSTSGIDDHPALKRDPATDPLPESVPAPAPPKASTKAASGSRPASPLDPAAGRETRKERRRRQFRAVRGERGA